MRCWSSRSNTVSDSVMEVGAPRRMCAAAEPLVTGPVICWLTSFLPSDGAHAC
jgi:hypothetical protein